MCVLFRHTFCESFVEIRTTKCINVAHFCDVFLRHKEILVLDMCVVSLKYRSNFPHCTVQIKIHHKVPILQVYTIITLHYFYVVYNTIHDEINMN